MPDPTICVDHVAIAVRNRERSVGFDRDLSGFEVLGQLVLNEGTSDVAPYAPGWA